MPGAVLGEDTGNLEVAHSYSGGLFPICRDAFVAIIWAF